MRNELASATVAPAQAPQIPEEVGAVADGASKQIKGFNTNTIIICFS